MYTLYFYFKRFFLTISCWWLNCLLWACLRNQRCEWRMVSPDYGKVYNLNECSIHDADNDLQSGMISQWLEMDWLHCHQGEQSCLQLFWLIVTWWQWQQGWAGLASDTEHQPSPASSHTAISANLPLCANNSADVLCFLEELCSLLPEPALFVRCPSSQPSLAFPLPMGTVELKSAVRALSLPWNGWVIEGKQVTGFRITWAGKCRGCG